MKKYVAIEATRDENAICLETGYDEGGHNWFSGATNRRGYYLYCTPVMKTANQLADGTPYETISQVLGKGNKLLLKEVTRRSKKAQAEAERLAEEKADWLLEKVMEKYGLKLIENESPVKSEKASLEEQIGVAESAKQPVSDVGGKNKEVEACL